MPRAVLTDLYRTCVNRMEMKQLCMDDFTSEALFMPSHSASA